MPSPRERLEILADFLERMKPNGGFNMGFWAADYECGFAGCAVGWATQIPALSADGLILSMGGIPLFGVFAGYDAASEFFGISHGDVYFLFDPWQYRAAHPRPQTVAKRIRKVLAWSAQ